MHRRAKKPDGSSRLRFDFNAAAQKALKDHPDLKNKILFFDARKDSWKGTAALLLEKGASDDDVKELGKDVRQARKEKTSFCQQLELDGGESLTVMVFHEDRHPLFGQRPGATDDAGTFDHELTHALAPELSGPRGENAADAYAALRHLQGGGAAADIEYCGWKRAAVFLKEGVTSHLTTFTVDKILCDFETADFMNLSPAETLAVAKDYAKKYTPSRKKLQSLSRTFNAVAKLAPRQALKKLADITLAAPANSGEFYLGARALSGALKGGGVTLDGQNIALKGAEWAKVKKALDAKIATLPKKHPLRRLAS